MRKSSKNILFVLIIILTSCVSTPEGAIRINSTSEIPAIQNKYPDRLENTRIGMEFLEFKQIWPESIKYSETQEFIIYEFKEITRYYTDYEHEMAFWYTGTTKTHEFIQLIYFYFVNNKLIKYEYKSSSSE